MTSPASNFAAWTLALQGPTAGAAPQPASAVGVPGAGSTAQSATPANGQAAPSGGMGMIFWMLPAMLLVMVLMQVLGARKEKKRRAEMLALITRGEKVQTMGGVIGTIIEVGDTDVVLRLEEGKVRVLKAAVQSVYAPKSQTAGTVEAKPETKNEPKAEAKAAR